jgi:hypothetical protein
MKTRKGTRKGTRIGTRRINGEDGSEYVELLPEDTREENESYVDTDGDLDIE